MERDQVYGGDYRILFKLSEGGMGSVFVAEQVSTGKRRALKLMKQELLRDPKLRERFILEARAASRIESEHVVEVVGAGVDEASGNPWLAMELLDGSDLASEVHRRGRLPLHEVREIFHQLGHALNAAHGAGIVHRDLKPENLFVAKPRRDGIPFTIKILDFGIAKVVRDATNGSSTGAIGTPLWMAPEQADSRSPITPATDIWPLGLIAYFALTGRHFWAGADAGSMTGLLRELLIDALVPPSVRAAAQGVAPGTLPPWFDAWFGGCVARDPAGRFRSAGGAIRAMADTRSGAPTGVAAPVPDSLAQTAFVNAGPTAQPQPTPVRPLPASTNRVTLVVALVIAPLVALSVGFGGYVSYQLRKPPTAGMAPSKQHIAEAKRIASLVGMASGASSIDGPIPIVKDAASWGHATPIVHAVLFCDWLNEHCEKLARSLDESVKQPGLYVRISVRHLARRGDREGLLAAQAAHGVFESAGSKAFVLFRDKLFAHRGEVTRTNVVSWAREVGVLDPEELGSRIDAGRWKPIVDRDGDLAAKLRINGSTFFANCQAYGGALDIVMAQGRAWPSLLDADERTRKPGGVGATTPDDLLRGELYRRACADQAKEYPAFKLSGGLAAPLRSPYASADSDDAVRDVFVRWVAAASQGDAASLAAVSVDEIEVHGRRLSAAAFARERSDRTKGEIRRAAIIGGVSVKRTADSATRIATADELVESTSAARKSDGRLVKTQAATPSFDFVSHEMRLVQKEGTWLVDADVSERAVVAEPWLLDHLKLALTAPEMATILFAAPNRGERTDHCIARAADIGACYPGECGMNIICDRGSLSTNVRYIEVDGSTGAVQAMPSIGSLPSESSTVVVDEGLARRVRDNQATAAAAAADARR